MKALDKCLLFGVGLEVTPLHTQIHRYTHTVGERERENPSPFLFGRFCSKSTLTFIRFSLALNGFFTKCQCFQQFQSPVFFQRVGTSLSDRQVLSHDASSVYGSIVENGSGEFR